MPELPEVETVVRTLRPAVVGRVVESVELLRDDFATPIGFNWPAALVGRAVADVSRRAKRIVVSLDDGNRFFAHLGMTGRLLFGPAGRESARHTHVRLTFAHGELHQIDPRRFGGLTWLGRDVGDADIGPEPLTLRSQQLAARLLRTSRPVKTALLDQTVIAGLGNIYADEALFASGIHPLCRCDQLDVAAARRLNRAIKATLNKAIEHRGSTLRDYRDADGNAGGFQNRCTASTPAPAGPVAAAKRPSSASSSAAGRRTSAPSASRFTRRPRSREEGHEGRKSD